MDCFTREWLAYTFSIYCGTDEAIKTLEMVLLERFPDRVVPPSPSHPNLVTTRSDGGSQYMSARFVSMLKVYGIRQEVTAGKNRPDQNAYIEAFHKSIKRRTVSGSMTFRHTKKPKWLPTNSSMITIGTDRIIIKVHDTEVVLCYGKWR
jgi:transposase InsO family protein